MSTIDIEEAMSHGGDRNFDYIKSSLVNGKYSGVQRVEGWPCIAYYHGKPIFGYIKHSIYAGDKLVLHRMDTTEYNSFAGSQAEHGQWILFSSLTDGKICKDHIEELKEYAEKEYGWSDDSIKNKPMKKKNAPINWFTKFQSNSEEYHISVTKDCIIFEGFEYKPKAFKENFDLRRAVLAKYEKEFGKLS